MAFSNRHSILLILIFLGFNSQAQIPVSTEAELQSIGNNLHGHYVLTNDITLTQEWIPIGNDSPFQGILDGSGHVISNLRINDSSNQHVGFFARTKDAKIINLGIENPQIKANQASESVNAGILIGNAISTSISNSYIQGGFVQSYGSAGSFAGKISAGTFPSRLKDSYSTANVTAEQLNAGGLVGISENTAIENTYFSGLAQAKYACGGILGSSVGKDKVSSSLVASASLKGLTVNRIVGEKRGNSLVLKNNYARADLLTGNLVLYSVPYAESFITGLQGESIPYIGTDYYSSFPNYTNEDINVATSSFNTAFYSKSRMLYFEYSSKIGKVAAIWTQAVLFDIMMNNYLRTRDDKEYTWMTNILEGNSIQYAGYNWDNGDVWFIYDDIMWWVISLARAYQVTGEVKYLNLSKTGFERVWSGSKILKDNGSYDPVNSGMYWAWNQNNPEGSPVSTMGKMACINYPTVLGAMTLFEITKDSTYFRKGLEIFDWAQNNLFDKQTGRVADSKHGIGNPTWKDHVYNQATSIGAAVILYKATGDRRFLDDAVMAANYTKNQMSKNGYLHFETGTEQGIYHAIFAQYIVRLIEDGRQYQYIPWLRYNINAGWANRLKSSNITYKEFVNPAPPIRNIQSYDASGLPALMQVIKPVSEDDAQINCLSRTFYENNLNWDFDKWTTSGNDALPKLSIFGTTS